MIVFQNQYYTISIDDNRSFLQLTWHKVVGTEQFKVGFKRAISCAIEHRVQTWLSDNRVGINFDMATQRWLADLATENLPKTCLRRFARVVPPDAFLQITSYQVNERIKPEVTINFQFEVFSDIDQAVYWLFEDNQISQPA